MLNHSLSSYLVPNLYNPETYFKLDIGPGRIRNRKGLKMVTLSNYMIRGLYKGLKKETGPAWVLILKRCGEIWGERYAERLLEEAEEFYSENVGEMKMPRFNALIAEALAVHGWGRAEFDYGKAHNGVILITIHNAITSAALHDVNDRQADILIAGIIRAILSKVTGQDLDCFQIDRVLGKNPKATFVAALSSRLQDVPELVEEGKSSDHILTTILETTV